MTTPSFITDIWAVVALDDMGNEKILVDPEHHIPILGVDPDFKKDLLPVLSLLSKVKNQTYHLKHFELVSTEEIPRFKP